MYSDHPRLGVFFLCLSVGLFLAWKTGFPAKLSNSTYGRNTRGNRCDRCGAGFPVNEGTRIAMPYREGEPEGVENYCTMCPSCADRWKRRGPQHPSRQ